MIQKCCCLSFVYIVIIKTNINITIMLCLACYLPRILYLDNLELLSKSKNAFEKPEESRGIILQECRHDDFHNP